MVRELKCELMLARGCENECSAYQCLTLKICKTKSKKNKPNNAKIEDDVSTPTADKTHKKQQPFKHYTKIERFFLYLNDSHIYSMVTI